MDIIRKIDGYATSRDYKTLFELMQKSSVICIIDYGETGRCRDIAHTVARKDWFEIGVRGICYVYAETLSGFIAQCEMANVEFIPPNAAPLSERAGER